MYQGDSGNSILADSKDSGGSDAGFKGFIGVRPGGLIWLREGWGLKRGGCRWFTIFKFLLLWTQTRRILLIHDDSGVFNTFHTQFLLIHDDLVYSSSRDLLGFRGRAFKQMWSPTRLRAVCKRYHINKIHWIHEIEIQEIQEIHIIHVDWTDSENADQRDSYDSIVFRMISRIQIRWSLGDSGGFRWFRWFRSKEFRSLLDSRRFKWFKWLGRFKPGGLTRFTDMQRIQTRRVQRTPVTWGI